MKNIKVNKFFLVIFLVVLLIEILIEHFASGNFIRSYVGDILVIVLIYSFLKIFMESGGFKLTLSIFLFALGVEFLQYINIVKLLNLQDNKFFSTIIGTTYDIKDVLCYFIGFILITVIDFIYNKKNSSFMFF